MAKPTIADFASLRNRQNQINDKISRYLGYLESLMDAVLHINFFELAKSTMQGYFLLVTDLINEVIELHQSTLIASQEKKDTRLSLFGR